MEAVFNVYSYYLNKSREVTVADRDPKICLERIVAYHDNWPRLRGQEREKERYEKRRQRGERSVPATWQRQCRPEDGDSDDGAIRDISHRERAKTDRGFESDMVAHGDCRRQEQAEMEAGEEGEGAEEREFRRES
ncbi:hypothetical protein TIFTF001_030612 [Ficus carica]|uniref:Uncharacterized protein n=1 Tax=Ficus carica TaxID=3494 RepID=A0AA88DTF0_FICCA|nr:hypothetical protein TIFTF001_030612 [Ficus carica]